MQVTDVTSVGTSAGIAEGRSASLIRPVTPEASTRGDIWPVEMQNSRPAFFRNRPLPSVQHVPRMVSIHAKIPSKGGLSRASGVNLLAYTRERVAGASAW